MNKKSTINNLKYSLASQALSIILGILRAIAIPIYLGITEFGYWQIYLLYAAFAGIFSYGFIDGIYLRYGHLQEIQLPLKSLRSSFYIYLISLSITTLSIYLLIISIGLNEDKEYAISFTAINILLICTTSYFTTILQITNQIKKFSKAILIDKIVFILMLMILLLTTGIDYKLLIAIDISSKLLLLVYLALNNKSYFLGKKLNIRSGITTYTKNIKAGAKLLLVNIIGILTLTICRVYIEKNFTIEEFSAYSLGITFTNLLLMVTAAISVVAYPALKREDRESYIYIYRDISNILQLISIISLLLYLPVYLLIETYMADYSQILPYLSLLFLICILEARTQILINTFYKALREEKRLLKINLANILLLSITLWVNSFIFNSIYSTTLILLTIILIRVISTEKHITKILDLRTKSYYIDIALIGGFTLATYNLKPDGLIYMITITLLSFIFFKNKELLGLIKHAR